MIIVDKKRPLYMIERTLYVNLCLISPYIYAWFAVFGSPQPDSYMHIAMIIMESFFLFNIIFSFFVELEVEGQIMPIRDLSITVTHFLKT